jgi:hypothetical protein
MRYEFLSAEGTPAEFDMPTSEAPAIGDTIRRGGRFWKRVVSSGVTLATQGLDYRVRNKGVIGRGLPKRHSMDPELQGLVDGWSPSGDAMFESDQKARRWTEKANVKIEREGSKEPAFDYSKDQPSGEDICDMQDKARRARYGA